MSDWAGIAWLFVLLAVNAFFVGAEFAVISARRSQIEPLAEQGSRSRQDRALGDGARHAHARHAPARHHDLLAAHPERLGAGDPSPARGAAATSPGWSAEAVSTVAFVITLVLVSYLHVVFGEMVPKNLSFSLPDRAVLLLAPPLVFVARMLQADHRRAERDRERRAPAVPGRAEERGRLDLHARGGRRRSSTSRGARACCDASGTLTAAFEFTTKRVKDVAVPLASLVSLPPGATPGDVERAVVRRGFSRYPILGADGEPDGYVHLKDVIDLDDDEFDDPDPRQAGAAARLDLRRHRPRGCAGHHAPARHARRAGRSRRTARRPA